MRNKKSNHPEVAYFIHESKCAIVSVFYAILILWAKCSYRKMWNLKSVPSWKMNLLLSFC